MTETDRISGAGCENSLKAGLCLEREPKTESRCCQNFEGLIKFEMNLTAVIVSRDSAFSEALIEAFTLNRHCDINR